jgi:hypothetical protein
VVVRQHDPDRVGRERLLARHSQVPALSAVALDPQSFTS